MSKIADLHIHSLYSDGAFTVKEIFQNAKKKNLAAISITDHDLIGSFEEAFFYSKEYQIEFITGIELTSYYKNYEVHVLGYFFDHKSEYLLNYLDKINQKRTTRAEKILANMRRDGINISMDDLLKYSEKGYLGRPHIAKALVEKKYAKSTAEAFKNFLHNRSKYNEKKFVIDPKEAVNIIHQAKGLAFFAHPNFLISNVKMIKEILSYSFDGLEAQHSSCNVSEVHFFEQLAKDLKILTSGGSDCHGGLNNGKVILGDFPIPYSWINKMKKRLEKKEQINL